MLDTSIMSGMSRENPALERFLLIDHIWSAYEVIGEVTMKTGATCVTAHLTKVIALYRCECQHIAVMGRQEDVRFRIPREVAPRR